MCAGSSSPASDSSLTPPLQHAAAPNGAGSMSGGELELIANAGKLTVLTPFMTSSANRCQCRQQSLIFPHVATLNQLLYTTPDAGVRNLKKRHRRLSSSAADRDEGGRRRGERVINDCLLTTAVGLRRNGPSISLQAVDSLPFLLIYLQARRN